MNLFKITIVSFVLFTTTLFQVNGQEVKKQTRIIKTEAEWREKLSPEVFKIMREKGTERPYTGKYDKHFEKGTYVCKACNTELFKSTNKYDSHCGWPAFDKSIAENIYTNSDFSFGMKRVEILCANCGGHLGHVFDDGPRETTGKRFCVNSAALQFEKED